MTNVVDIREYKEKIRYRFLKEIQTDVEVLGNGQKKNRTTILIMLERVKDGVSKKVVHPLSQYLLEPKQRGGKYSPITQNNKASLIVKFLNYTLIDNGVRFNIKDFTEIGFEHGTMFLNSLTDISNETKDRYIAYLTKFYYYLAKKNLLHHVKVSDFEFRINNNGYNSISSPFYGVEYNSYVGVGLIHKIPIELLIYFIDTALTFTPEIALGVCFQCFGGLRLGEVVNIKKSNLRVKGPFGKYGFVVNLRDNNMRDDLKHPVLGGSVKVRRKQAIFPYGGDLLQKIYKFHIEHYRCKGEDNALFVNKDGNPMADFTYRYYFNKLKYKFIERLKKSDDINLRHYAIDLESVRWSTHIGRGTFSNIVASVSKSITEIAQARGDKALDSSLTYLTDSDKMTLLLYENNTEMWELLEQEIDELNQ
ncbi:hypothetical protein BH721_03900 [Clostridium baratii]|uniref:site-specific integrase n=1 Tax=Clostridium baratii TaxID=1561 RepID=UPI0009A31E24|nr:site-specific integrase [Clostridium baratii]OPF52407.1 hypothetical protein A1M12_10105 [Clostridium baratii]OPF55857.1 hypothetical protein BH721_03900 [Clostridium baratii]OPF56762.1 hypothetical protein BH724_09525 [Clostridium baratii]OPF59761.1 hypothetical protein BH725_04025 [Clostridium baratii]